MRLLSRDRSASDPEYSDGSPFYEIISREMGVTAGVSALLMSVTIILMLLVSQTPLATLGLGLYNIFPLLGVFVFGILISVGRHFGMKGLVGEDMTVALFGIALSIFGYGWFGGSILSQYDAGIYVPAILITGGITMAITIGAAVLVFGTGYGFMWAGKASGISFLLGLGVILVGSFVLEVLLVIGFFLFLLGFLFDLVFEIYLTSENKRTPVANGLGVYIAFAGVFVHILQLVLRSLARD